MARSNRVRARADEPEYKAAARASARTLPQGPLLSALAVLAVGMVVIGFGHWRVGLYVVAAGIGLSGLLRLVLPRRLAGLLVVRSRGLDATMLLGAAVAVALLAFTR